MNGEGDRISGLVIDVYGKTAVLSASARWLEVYKTEVHPAPNPTPKPSTLHHTPEHPTPCCTLHPTIDTLLHAPCTLDPELHSINNESQALLCAPHTQPYPRALTLTNFKFQTPHPTPPTPNPKPQTPNPNLNRSASRHSPERCRISYASTHIDQLGFNQNYFTLT